MALESERSVGGSGVGGVGGASSNWPLLQRAALGHGRAPETTFAITTITTATLSTHCAAPHTAVTPYRDAIRWLGAFLSPHRGGLCQWGVT